MAHAVVFATLNSSLENWGFQDLFEESEYDASIEGPLIDLHSLRTAPISFDASFTSESTEDFATLLMNVAFIMVCLGLLFFCLLTHGDYDEDEEYHAVDLGKLSGDGPLLSHEHKLKYGSTDWVNDVQCSEGSWAQAYREANHGDEREALELLFRCHIISTYEFAESKVSQEHIEECIWIGTHMLRQKPLSDWVAMRYQAKTVFEEHAAACFQVNSDGNARSSHQRLDRSNTPSPLQSARRYPTSTTSSLSLDSHRQDAIIESPSYAEPPQKLIPTGSSCSSSGDIVQEEIRRPAVEPPKMDYPYTKEFKGKVVQQPVLNATPVEFSTFLHTSAAQQKVMPKQSVLIPRMNLAGLAKEQSSRENDDDDPYTTRDIF